MSIVSLKKKVFGEIAAAKTLAESMPKFKSSSSLESINNSSDAIAFLCDLIKTLIGYQELEKVVTETLVYYSKPIEQEVKNLLKTELKSIVSCGINPSLPNWIKSTGPGINIIVKKIDFTDLMLIDPNSEAGKLMYNDLTPNLIDSSDFNTFLYQTIQDNGVSQRWPRNNPILTFQFNQTDVNGIKPNNTLTIKAHPDYDTKTLNDLNNDYIDSISLFNLENLMTNVFDSIYGTVSSFAKKSISQLENKLKIDTVVNKISNATNKDIISDKYFDFTKQENLLNQQLANSQRLGIKTENLENKVNTKLNINSVKKLNGELKTASSDLNQTKKILTDNIKSITNQISGFAVTPSDKESVKLNFIQEIVNKLTKTVINSILSPKVISIFVINFKIVYGPNEDFTDAIDFMKKNKNLINNIIKRITGILIKVLMKIVMKKISELAIERQKKKITDKATAKLAQLLSLIGVPDERIRKIKGFL